MTVICVGIHLVDMISKLLPQSDPEFVEQRKMTHGRQIRHWGKKGSELRE